MKEAQQTVGSKWLSCDLAHDRHVPLQTPVRLRAEHVTMC